jgi:hypothetical protein
MLPGSNINRPRLKDKRPLQSHELGLALYSELFHFQDKQGAVIERMGAAGESVNLLQDFVGDPIGVELVVRGDQVGQASVAEEFSCGILRVADAIGVENHNVAFIQDITPLIVS